MAIGFTGTQQGMTQRQKDALHVWLRELRVPHVEFHHGDCIGADKEADGIAHSLGYTIAIHPPILTHKRAWCDAPPDRVNVKMFIAKEYIARNHDIVDACEVLIACPATVGETIRSGTWATVRYARKIGKRVIVIEP